MDGATLDAWERHRALRLEDGRTFMSHAALTGVDFTLQLVSLADAFSAAGAIWREPRRRSARILQ